MGAIQLPDELQRVIEGQVVEGRAASAAAFLEEAVMRLVGDAEAEELEVRQAVQTGLADIEAGRYSTVTTRSDESRLQERLMIRLRDCLGTDV